MRLKETRRRRKEEKIQEEKKTEQILSVLPMRLFFCSKVDTGALTPSSWTLKVFKTESYNARHVFNDLKRTVLNDRIHIKRLFLFIIIFNMNDCHFSFSFRVVLVFNFFLFVLPPSLVSNFISIICSFYSY